MGAPRFVMEDFWPSDLFLGGIPGAWYDPTDLSTMFQDSTGTTPVTAVEQPVGLILDKSQGLALGAEVVTNGTFAINVTGWTAQAGDTVSWDAGDSGRLKIDDTNGAGAGIAYQIINTVAGRGYTVQFSSKLGTAAQTRVYVGTAVGNASMAQRNDSADVTNGTIFFIASGATAYLQFVCQSTSAFSYLLDISVKPIAGNHASQSTAASRPTYRSRYNLLTYSEDFGNAAWIKLNASASTNVTTSPDGTVTADALVEDAANTFHIVSRGAGSVSCPGIGTFSCYLKASTRTAAVLQINEGANRYAALFDLTNGVVAATNTTGTPTSTSNSIASVGNGWYRCTVSCAIATTCDTIVALSNSLTPVWTSSVPTYAGNGTSGVFLWGAQLLTAADVTATGNAYQRIAGATVYDTAPIFRPYLAFDGVDDSLSTAAINFTSTDKMTVFAGVTKLSTATFDFAGLSPDWPTNIGTFAIGSVSPNGWFFGLRGTGFEYYTATSFVAPLTSVLTASYNIGGATIADEIVPRVNGTTPTLTPSGGPAGTGNFGTHVLNISRSASWFNGRLFSLIVRGAASSVTEIADTELWVNARTGAY